MNIRHVPLENSAREGRRPNAVRSGSRQCGRPGLGRVVMGRARARYEISLLASVEIEKTKLSSLYGLLYDMMGYRPVGNLIVFIILYLLRRPCLD